MNRRQFIKRGSLFVPAIFIPSLIRAVPPYVAMYSQPQNAVGNSLIVATDNFTRANSSTLGANYTACGASGAGMGISSNQAIGQGSLVTMNAWTANTFHNDQYAIVTYFLAVPTSTYLEAAVRLTGSDTSLIGYRITTDGANWFLSKITGTTSTDFTSGTLTMTVGDTLKITVVATTISAYHNGTLLATANDSTYTSGSAGIGAYSSSQASALEVGNMN